MSDRSGYSVLSRFPSNRFHSCILTTFSFDFNFFEHVAITALNRAGVSNTCVFVDDSMLQQYLGTLTGYAGKVARRYSMVGIPRRGAFHPKLCLLFGREAQAFLIIGSGNLTASGHGGNEELWGALHIDGPSDPKAPIFKKAWQYVYLLSSETSGIARRKVEWVHQHAPWLDQIQDSSDNQGVKLSENVEAFLLSNGGGNILSKIYGILADENIREITLVSPFFDSQTLVLHELASVYKDASIHVIVQPETCSPLNKNDKYEGIVFHEWNTVQMPQKRNNAHNRYLHAKLLHIRTESHEYCMFGSANMTAAAVGTQRKSAINEELCLLLRRNRGDWLDDLGLKDRGRTISPTDIIGSSMRAAEPNYLHEARPIRLKAIDLLGMILQVYMDKIADVEDFVCRLFDGWGNTILAIAFETAKYIDDQNCYQVKTSEQVEGVIYAQVFRNATDEAVSNKQIVHDARSLSRTNPDPSNQKMEELLTRIENDDAHLIDILKYLSPDDLIKKEADDSHGGKPAASKNGNEDDGTGEVLEYDEFTKISSEHIAKENFVRLYGTHRIERVLETLRILFRKLEIPNAGKLTEDEEADKERIESSEGRPDSDEKIAAPVPGETSSGFATLQKSVYRFFDQYISILEQQRRREHKVNILDASMFAISLHLLLSFLNKPISIRKRGDIEEVYSETLLSANGDYFQKTDYCRIVADLIGKFTLLLVNKIDDSNDEYVKTRIEKCRKMAYWHGICCIARLVPCPLTEKNSEDPSELWKRELAMNLHHYFAPNDVLDEAVADEEIDYRTKMINGIDGFSRKAHITAFWKDLVREYNGLKCVGISHAVRCPRLSPVYWEYCGFSHIYRSIIQDGDQRVTLARPGFPANELKSDFEGKIVMAKGSTLKNILRDAETGGERSLESE